MCGALPRNVMKTTDNLSQTSNINLFSGEYKKKFSNLSWFELRLRIKFHVQIYLPLYKVNRDWGLTCHLTLFGELIFKEQFLAQRFDTRIYYTPVCAACI